jgi:1-deoxy-D-xylulose-5-phosphate synthase
MRSMPGPKILHVVTKKGKGYEQAEQDPIKWHAVPKFDHTTEKLPVSKPGNPSYSAVFGNWLCDMAAQDPDLIAITPAMREGSGMVKFSQQFPDQYIDVAIAEQHSVTLAAGLARENKNAVVAIYSTFLQRAYDQLIHDVAIQNLPVLFAIDRAGIVGADGPTHQGAFDISFMRCIPNLVVMTPGDEAECRNMLYTGHKLNQPAAVRYPRGAGMGVDATGPMITIPLGESRTLREIDSNKANDSAGQSKKVAILNFGSLLPEAIKAADILNTALIDMRFVKPLDEKAVLAAAKNFDLLVTLEDGAIAGGAGSAVCECLQKHKTLAHVLQLGLPDEFIMQGTQNEMYAELGIDSAGIVGAISNYK